MIIFDKRKKNNNLILILNCTHWHKFWHHKNSVSALKLSIICSLRHILLGTIKKFSRFLGFLRISAVVSVSSTIASFIRDHIFRRPIRIRFNFEVNKTPVSETFVHISFQIFISFRVVFFPLFYFARSNIN